MNIVATSQWQCLNAIQCNLFLLSQVCCRVHSLCLYILTDAFDGPSGNRWLQHRHVSLSTGTWKSGGQVVFLPFWARNTHNLNHTDTNIHSIICLLMSAYICFYLLHLGLYSLLVVSKMKERGGLFLCKIKIEHG